MFCFLFLSQCLPQVHVLTLQFVAARKATAGALVVWADLTKFGRLGVNDLNFVVTIVHKALSKVPTKGVAILIAPHLVSEKVSGGQRGEVRSFSSTEPRFFFSWVLVLCLFLRCYFVLFCWWCSYV